MNIKTIQSIATFSVTADNETMLTDKDEQGKDLTIVLNTLELLEWIEIDYMKEQTIKYIKNL